MQSKIFKYIQDWKWGIQNEKIDVKELEFLEDPYVKEEKKFELSIEKDEVNEDSDLEYDLDLAGEVRNGESFGVQHPRFSSPQKINIDEFKTEALDDLFGNAAEGEDFL